MRFSYLALVALALISAAFLSGAATATCQLQDCKAITDVTAGFSVQGALTGVHYIRPQGYCIYSATSDNGPLNPQAGVKNQSQAFSPANPADCNNPQVYPVPATAGANARYSDPVQLDQQICAGRMYGCN